MKLIVFFLSALACETIEIKPKHVIPVSAQLPLRKFGCNQLDLLGAFKEVNGNFGSWVKSHATNYICDATPRKMPDTAYQLMYWAGLSYPANLEYMVQDCQTFIYGAGKLMNGDDQCQVPGNNCHDCRAPKNILGKVHIKRDILRNTTTGAVTGYQCRYVRSC
eukprot:TRINITY_DN48126_c0_g1_i1.p1 TRINITY_DN48126_c0_g1~~TRINITY_DN48126_c0_g1_i1.p1  ORF type:complete len:163 (+),score=13.31 TRINITY_DN48126_c0_g1_i1:82-570(+)